MFLYSNAHLRNNVYVEIYEEGNIIYTSLLEGFDKVRAIIENQSEDIYVYIEELERQVHAFYITSR